MGTAYRFAFAVSFMALAAACGDSGEDTNCTECDSPEGGSSGDGGSTGDGGSVADGGSGTGGQDNLDWQTLITGEWDLAPGGEITSDIHTITADRDIYVGAIRPIAPPGTHHTVLALGNLGTGNIIYASGVNTNALVFPEGVGLKIPAGETIVLQLHLFNPTPDAMSELSGIEIVEVAPEDLVNEADLFLPGPMSLNIPPNQESTETGSCTVSSPQTLFAIFPHMHQLGSHFKSTATVGGETIVIHDDDYSFDHQAFLPIEPIQLNPGDTINTECTWNNTTSETVNWGESSTTEMCFSIVYRYPAQNDAGFCP
ncbi:MAG: hypothetical protein HOW73_05225 [Polyangiaceae bacterium]|nr:hypothetical protein [Polyangiaceae bacterium]